MDSYTAKSDTCCPISCAGLELFAKERILIKRCLPIRGLCNDPDIPNPPIITLFDSNLSPDSTQLPSGVITVVNTTENSSCSMVLFVTDVLGAVSTEVENNSSFTVTVNRLSIVFIVCVGPDQTEFCTGTYEMDLSYDINK
ncbi:S-Ena type endospore appendage [Chengkuizengella axinellae]|uniref:Endospore appendages core domain-containing protein n=1 Tax=Chengkuizengella axinellae TaxID=3064388 RepID=A0ABT9ITY2_9BACL|nr:S-Ena type endospore appendage [Chengkuizengella sp. 2205SS18-9]MDP5272795.1 hypothetical protein [Chengkuizengella sp. 2205SS18-9]